LQLTHVCLHMSSNASIEAGLMGVPSIAVDPCGYSSHLHIEQYLPVVSTSDALHRTFDEILANYKEYQKCARAYAYEMYGGYTCGAGFRIRDYILTLVQTGYLDGAQTIPDTIFLADDEDCGKKI